jgi:hypothetical protein
MSYSKEELERLSLEAIEEHNPPFINHLISHLPCSSSTFYDLGLEKSEAIKDAINKVKTGKKTKLLDKMSDSDSASAQIAAYKLLSDDNEFSKLSGQQLNQTIKAEVKTSQKYDLSKLSDEDLDAHEALLEKAQIHE